MTQRLGILVSHPIQYYAPWFRYLASRVDVEVFYAQGQDGKGQADAGFGVEFEWDVPLLEGYRYRWMKNIAKQPSIATFNGLDTPELYKIIEPGRFDAFLLFGWNRKAYWQAMRACRRAGIPVLMRGDSHLETRRSVLTSLGKYIPYRTFLPRIDAHLYVGQRNKAYLKHYGIADDKLFFSPHFVDSKFFRRGADDADRTGRANEMRAELRISPDAFVCLFVGKLLPIKRPSDLIQATINLSLHSREIHAVFVGDGPLRVELEQRAKTQSHRIHFVGFRNQSELPLFYQMTDALVLPSTAETWGLVVNEAQACGLPCVVGENVGCAPDLIDEGETGFTFPTGSIVELSNRIGQVITLCDRNKANILEAIEKKVNEYSIEAATNGLQQAMQFIHSSQKRTLKHKKATATTSAV